MATNRVCAIAVTGIATTVLTGSVTMTITGSPARAGFARSILLTAGAEASASSLEQAIELVLDATKRATDYNAGRPFATDSGIATLPKVMSNNNFELMVAGLSGQINNVFFRYPELVAGDAAEPRQLFQFFNPDFDYSVKANLDPHATYQLTGTLGHGTEHLAISAGPISEQSATTSQYLESGSTLVVNPDGTYTVTIGPTAPPGDVNYIDSLDALDPQRPGVGVSLLIRDMMGDSAKGPGTIAIECVADCPAAPTASGSGLTEDQLTQLLLGLGTPRPAGQLGSVSPIELFNQQNMNLAAGAGISLPGNTMSAIEPETFFGVGLPTARISAGNFDVNPGQALVIKVPEVESAYSGIQLMNAFGSSLPFVFAQTSLNNTQAYQAHDGYTYYVVSATNPGVANWLDSGQDTKGEIFARFEGLAGSDPTGMGVQTFLVPLSQLHTVLPEDTPTVSGSQFAGDMTQRVLSHDYALDVSRQSSFSLDALLHDPKGAASGSEWLIQQVLLHDVQNIMGTDQFNQVFGSEPFTPMWLRLAPGLSPDWLMLMKDVLTDPHDSFTALQNNAGLAIKDVVQPALLTLALLQQSNGIEGVGKVLYDAVFDPNISITAGFLNARDDLATAIFAATGGFPEHADPLATLAWQFLPHLAQNGRDFGSLNFNQLNDLPELVNPIAYLSELFS